MCRVITVTGSSSIALVFCPTDVAQFVFSSAPEIRSVFQFTELPVLSMVRRLFDTITSYWDINIIYTAYKPTKVAH